MSEQGYVMPCVYVGDIVMWYAALEGEGAPALVTRVGNRHLCLAVFIPGFQNASAPDGTLHRHDPQARRMLENDGGFWDYCEHDPRRSDAATPAPAQEKKAAAKSS